MAESVFNCIPQEFSIATLPTCNEKAITSYNHGMINDYFILQKFTTNYDLKKNCQYDFRTSAAEFVRNQFLIYFGNV